MLLSVLSIGLLLPIVNTSTYNDSYSLELVSSNQTVFQDYDTRETVVFDYSITFKGDLLFNDTDNFVYDCNNFNISGYYYFNNDFDNHFDYSFDSNLYNGTLLKCENGVLTINLFQDFIDDDVQFELVNSMKTFSFIQLYNGGFNLLGKIENVTTSNLLQSLSDNYFLPTLDSNTLLSIYTFIDGVKLNNYVAGYNKGYSDGYSNGYVDGYNQGVSIDSTVSTVFNGILNVALVPINFFLAIFNFEILGINMSGFVSALLTVACVIIIVKLFTGNKTGGA